MADGKSEIWKWLVGVLLAVVMSLAGVIWSLTIIRLQESVDDLEATVNRLNEHIAQTEIVLIMHGVTADNPPRR